MNKLTIPFTLLSIFALAACGEENRPGPSSASGGGGTSTAGSDSSSSGGSGDICGVSHVCALTPEPIYCRLDASGDPTTTCDDYGDLQVLHDSVEKPTTTPNRRCYGAASADSYQIYSGQTCVPDGDPAPNCDTQCGALTAVQMGLPNVWVSPKDQSKWEFSDANCFNENGIVAINYAQATCDSPSPSSSSYVAGDCSQEECDFAAGDSGLDETGDECDPMLVEWSPQARCIWKFDDSSPNGTHGDATAQLRGEPNDAHLRILCVGPDASLHTDAYSGEAERICGNLEAAPDGADTKIFNYQGTLLGQDFGQVEEWDHDADPATDPLKGFAICDVWDSTVRAGFNGSVGECGCPDGAPCENATADGDDIAVTADPCPMDTCSELEAECLGTPETNDLAYADHGAQYTTSGGVFTATLDLAWVDAFARYNPGLLWACDPGRLIMSREGSVHDFQDLGISSVARNLGFRDGDAFIWAYETTGAPNYTQLGAAIELDSALDIGTAFATFAPASGAFDISFDTQTTAGDMKTIRVSVQ